MSFTDTFATKTGSIALSDLDRALSEAAMADFDANATYDAGTVGAAIKQILSEGASGESVQALINATLQSYDASVTARLSAINPTAVGPFTVDGRSFADLNAVLLYLSQKAGEGGVQAPSAPVPITPPSISDSTVDFDQVVTVTPGDTDTASDVTTRLYRWIVNGTAQSSLWNADALNSYASQPVGGIAPTVNQALVLEELLYWAGGTPVSNKSVQYTLNAGAAVPLRANDPVVQGTASPGNTLSVGGGTWTNGPLTSDGYTFYVYDGGTPAQGGALLVTYAGQTAPLSFVLTSGVYDSKTLVFGVTASNAAGTSQPAYSAPVLVSGGLKPASISPVGFRSGTFAVGNVIQLEYGLLAGTSPSDFWSNNPSATGFLVQMYRNGVAITGGGSNVTQYTAVSADQDKILSYSVTASNGAGISTPAYAAGVLVVAGSGGGGTGDELEPGHNYLVSISSARWAIVNARLASYPATEGFTAPDPQALVNGIPTSGGTTLSATGSNDSGAINTALTNYSVVFLNAGTYVCPDMIEIPTNKKLIGVAGAEVVLDHSTNYGSGGNDGYGVHMHVGSHLVNVNVYNAGGLGVWVDETANNFFLYKVTCYRVGHNSNQPTNRRFGTSFYLAANASGSGGHTGVAVSCEAIQGYDQIAAGGSADGFRVGCSGGGNMVLIDCFSFEQSDDGFDCWNQIARNWLFWCKSSRSGKNVLTTLNGDGNGFKLGGDSNGTASGDIPVPNYLYACSTDDNKYYGFNWNNNAAIQILENPAPSGDDAGLYSYRSNGTADPAHYQIIIS